MSASPQQIPQTPTGRWTDFLTLAKPRVISLILFCATIGMLLATPDLPSVSTFFCAILGIAGVASAAAAMNCLLERHIDARMARTQNRPLPAGRLSSAEVGKLASVVGTLGLGVLYYGTNALTMWLTLATFVGYALIYTVFLKPATPQNIVIGGASGAMPPVLGWAAVSNQVSADALILFLIIFIWTPPHFWALALYRREEYAKSGLPMLPVTHGPQLTRLHIFLYTLALLATTLLPLATQMSGLFYFGSIIPLNLYYAWLSWQLLRIDDKWLAKRAFRYSILYLSLLFAALLVDHYAHWPLSLLSKNG